MTTTPQLGIFSDKSPWKAFRILSIGKIPGKEISQQLFIYAFKGLLETQVTMGVEEQTLSCIVKIKPDNVGGRHPLGRRGLIRLLKLQAGAQLMTP